MPRTCKRSSTVLTIRAAAISTQAAFEPVNLNLVTLQQLRSLPMVSLHQELKCRNLPHTGNKSVLSKRLYDTFNQTTRPLMASTTSHASDLIKAHANTCTNGTDPLLLQLHQLLQQQLTALLLQALSHPTANPLTPTLLSQPVPSQYQFPSATEDQLSEASLHGSPEPPIRPSTAIVSSTIPQALMQVPLQIAYQHSFLPPSSCLSAYQNSGW